MFGAFANGFKPHDGLSYEAIAEKYRGKIEMIDNFISWIDISIKNGQRYAEQKSKAEEEKK